MGLPPMHSRAGLDLPISTDVAAIFLAVGVVVVLVIGYDMYSQHYSSEVERGD